LDGKHGREIWKGNLEGKFGWEIQVRHT
jgi:hypothetical protein